MEIRRYEPSELSDVELRALHRFRLLIGAEETPNDPPQSYEQFVANIRNIPDIVEVVWWAAWEGDEVVARGNCVTPHIEGNEHLVQFELNVHPAWRRRGLGTRLLREITGAAHAQGRRLIITASQSNVPAGGEFLRSAGFQSALEGETNELQLDRVDRALMRSWIERAAERASGLHLDFWCGRYPEDRLEQVAEMMDQVNTVPLGELDVEEFHFTPENVRDLDDNNERRGVTRWNAYVEDEATGTIAGFTEIFFTNAQPVVLRQELTAVRPEYRNRGIGRWIKAAMVEQVLAEIPEARVIRTGNANENAPMLNINREMGFAPVSTQIMWQAPVEGVEQYLATRSASQELSTA